MLHPEFVDGKYALFTRPQDGFIEVGGGGGIGWGLTESMERAEMKNETIMDGKVYHTIKEVKNGQAPNRGRRRLLECLATDWRGKICGSGQQLLAFHQKTTCSTTGTANGTGGPTASACPFPPKTRPGPGRRLTTTGGCAWR